MMEQAGTSTTSTLDLDATLSLAPEDAQAQLKRLKRWRASTFWVMLVGYIGYYLCRANLSAALPLLSETFHYTNSQLGLIGFYSELGYAIGKFINGSLGDQIGGKRIFLIGMAGAIALNWVFTLSTGLTFFIVVWSLCRFFLSMGWGGIIKTIGTWYEKSVHGTVMGFISINFQFGGVLGTVLCGYLVARGASWQDLFRVPAIIVSVIWLWSALCSKDSPQDVVPGTSFGNSGHGSKGLVDYAHHQHDARMAQPSTWTILRGLLRHKVYRQSILFNMLMTILRVFFMFWTPKILVDIGMGTANAILKSAIFPLLGCVGTILLGWYTDKHAKNGDRAGMMWMMLAGLVLCLAAITLLLPQGMVHANAIVLLLGLSGFFLYGPYAMSTGALALDIAGPAGASTACGILDGLAYSAAAAAMWGAGKLADASHGRWIWVLGAITVIAVFSTLSAFFMSQELQKGAA